MANLPDQEAGRLPDRDGGGQIVRQLREWQPTTTAKDSPEKTRSNMAAAEKDI
jgi:hypothetical protein